MIALYNHTHPWHTPWTDSMTEIPTPFISQWALQTCVLIYQGYLIWWRKWVAIHYPYIPNNWSTESPSTRCPHSLQVFFTLPCHLNAASERRLPQTWSPSLPAKIIMPSFTHFLTQPLPQQEPLCIEGHYVVLRASVIGLGQLHAVLLVDPTGTNKSQDTLVTKPIWRSDRKSRNSSRLNWHKAYFEE